LEVVAIDGTSLLLGFPPTTLTPTIMQTVNKSFPESLLFCNNHVIQSQTAKDIQQLSKQEESKVVHLSAIPKDQAIHIHVLVGKGEVDIVVKPTLLLRDLMSMLFPNMEEYFITGPDGQAIETDSVEMESTTRQYIDLLQQMEIECGDTIVFIAQPKE